MKTNHNDPYPYAWNRQDFIVGNCNRVINKFVSGVLATSWWYIWMEWESLGECVCLSHSYMTTQLSRRCTTRKGRVSMSYMSCSKWWGMLTKMLHLCILTCHLWSVVSVSHPRCQGPLALLCDHLPPLIYLCFSRFVPQYDILDCWPPVTDALELLDNQWR